MFVGSLAWVEVDPRRQPFSYDHLEPRARRALEALASRRGWEAQAEEALERTFCQSVGPWAAGWRWTRDEGTMGGGVVNAWCCPDHSVDEPGDTAKRAVAALRQWRDHLERMAALFENLPSPPDDPEDGARSLEEAATTLVAWSVEETCCGNAWYDHAATVLTWFLEDRGASSKDAARAADHAVGGRFLSWEGPTLEILSDVVSDFGKLGWQALQGRRRR